ncbi:DUF4350 domain-containing protein [Belliella kenyensis]|uniref:DUF4350 domain-containing protein n=1 Tax=Belliella kenyensis TaxID=1472724 RepID=A0ABV8EK66_9BACT|nr:DUF4350 domain-containing protein [Belliella kenyensis]MCH7402316.1 DUF4350 domain-containing protein [Belliella kenyensis]MDN3603507.1 DUF4350 domain-containing protein [Belliella kenyensis]
MRQKKFKILIGVLVSLILFLLFLQTQSRQGTSWLESYDKSDSSPYGGRVFHDLFTSIDPDRPVEEIDLSTYEWLRRNPDDGALLVFNLNFSVDQETQERLLNWVSQGNTAFISARAIRRELLDTLGVKRHLIFAANDLRGEAILSLENKTLLNQDEILFNHSSSLEYFTFSDSLDIKVLGKNKYKASNNESQPNFIQVDFGEGKFLLHTFPLAFSNYFLLDKDRKRYTEGILAYFPRKGNLYYDNYNKIGRRVYDSPLYLFLSNVYLKMAYYVFLVAVGLWVVFEGRRKQRVIPVIVPLENQTVAFAETISGMYLEKKAYSENINQQILLFNEYCRNQYRVDIQVMDEETVTKLSSRSGCPTGETEELFDMINQLLKQTSHNESQVLQLNKKIHEFKSYNHGRK